MPQTPVGWIARLAIGQKLAVAFGLILLLLVVSFSATLVYLSRVNSYVDRHQRITIPGVVTASEMLRNISDIETAMHHAREHLSDANRTAGFAAIADIERRTLAALDTYQAAHAARTHPVLYGMLEHHGRTDLALQEDQAVVAIADGLTSLRAQREDLASALGTHPADRAGSEAAYEQAATRTKEAIAALIEVHRKIDVEMKIEGDRLVDQARMMVMGILGVLTLLIVAVYGTMKRHVANPLTRLAATADRVAHHDLAAQFEPWPSRDEVGALAGSLATMLASLRDHSTALMRKTKELEAFTYSIAHDLKGPLREIEGFSSILEKQFAESNDAPLRHHIGVIRQSALRLTHMIDALLKYSRLEQQDLPRIRFNVMELITGMVTDRLHPRSGATPAITVNLPFSDLYGEPVSVRQAITNLLDNAIKFSARTVAPALTIGGEQTPKERILWIRDNGIGFDTHQAGKLFGLFERLHSPGEYEGTGVGLAIVKLVMDKHGGRVWAESTPGQGSTFYLAFPNQVH
ncbi:MAG: ATP-binding protein [Nitrospira sp.]|jgi:signal transduction histidine kinase|nr:ATP-binding protein [Nitrospira sp.]